MPAKSAEQLNVASKSMPSINEKRLEASAHARRKGRSAHVKH